MKKNNIATLITLMVVISVVINFLFLGVDKITGEAIKSSAVKIPIKYQTASWKCPDGTEEKYKGECKTVTELKASATKFCNSHCKILDLKVANKRCSPIEFKTIDKCKADSSSSSSSSGNAGSSSQTGSSASSDSDTSSDSSSSSGSSSSSSAGSSSNAQTSPPGDCSDSDNGDYYTYGTCHESSTNRSYADGCSPINNMVLDERLCSSSNRCLAVPYTCPNGCRYGVCLPDALSEDYASLDKLGIRRDILSMLSKCRVIKKSNLADCNHFCGVAEICILGLNTHSGSIGFSDCKSLDATDCMCCSAYV